MDGTGSAGRPVTYREADAAYFEARGLRRHAGVVSLGARGRRGHLGPLLGLEPRTFDRGVGRMFVATCIIAVMYLGLTFSIAEMALQLPHTGGAYSLPAPPWPWGGFLTGLENVEYVLVPGVIVFFIGSYLTGIFGTDPALQPLWWIAGTSCCGPTVLGVELSASPSPSRFSPSRAWGCSGSAPFRVPTSNACTGYRSWRRPPARGRRPVSPERYRQRLRGAALRGWLFLAVEQVPLPEESHDPRRMPGHRRRVHAPAVGPGALVEPSGPRRIVRAQQPGEPRWTRCARCTAAPPPRPCSGRGHRPDRVLPHDHLRQGRILFAVAPAISRRPSLTHGRRRASRRHDRWLARSVRARALVRPGRRGGWRGDRREQPTWPSRAMFSTSCRRWHSSNCAASYRTSNAPSSAPGMAGPILTIDRRADALLPAYGPVYRQGVLGVAVWFAAGVAWFAAVGRHRLVLSPEEAFALDHDADDDDRRRATGDGRRATGDGRVSRPARGGGRTAAS